MRIRRALGWTAGGLAVAAAAAVSAVRLTTFHPPDRQDETVACAPGAPALRPGDTVRVMTWNVQYMAGKGHVFFYDVPGDSGPDDRPTEADVRTTLAGVARVIREEDPDVLLLQEVDEGAARTGGMDQLAELRKLLPAEYRCHASAWYWKAAYVPHPRIRSSVGMKLSILSRHRISAARRHQLALMPNDPVTRQFHLRRAVLEADLPVEGGRPLSAMSTHLEAFSAGSRTMDEQVAQVDSLLAARAAEGRPFVIGGDFNLLPDASSYAAIHPEQRSYYNPVTEIAPLFARWRAVPSKEEATGPERARWFTHIPNDPRIARLDRTLDYLFFPRDAALGRYHVRQRDADRLSDHVPVIAEYVVPR